MGCKHTDKVLNCGKTVANWLIQICLESLVSVLNGELYAQRLMKLIYLNLFTGCFMKISLRPSEAGSDEWRET